ncbi:MAG TPA: hypothetical protein VNM43_03040 [Dehalococcoidia bacterium]|nr:hypothetical protein [Dehalococcoidia bacterium]
MALGLLSAAALSLAGWMVVSRLVESGESPLARYERIAEEDAAKPRFTGQIGDFLVFSQLELSQRGDVPAEARIFDCPSTPVPLSDSLRRQELWSDVFEQGGTGWSCPGQGVVLISNGPQHGEQTPPGDGSRLARGYFRSLPVPVILDAPRDRLELVTVEGHPGLLERPPEGLPYGKANLIVIERYPKGDTLGIFVEVRFAPSVEAAIKHAEGVIP